MRVRAAAVEKTRRRILDAMFTLAAERLLTDIGLDAVARTAGVSVQTVLRQFGSRARLLEATAEQASQLVAVERPAPDWDVAGALRALVDHYERRGDAIVMLLAQESAHPALGQVVRGSRTMHRGWVTEVFTPLLEPLSGAPREEAIDLLAVATDVYTWTLLRRGRGLSKTDAEARLARLVEAVVRACVGPGDPTAAD